MTSGTESGAGSVSRIEFRSDDQDETRAYLRRNYGEHSRVIHGKGQFLYTIRAAATARIIGARSRRQLNQTLRAAVAHPTLFFSWSPGQRWRYGRKEYAVDPANAVISAPGLDYTAMGPSADNLVLRVDSELLERAIAERVGARSRRWLVRLVPVPLTAVQRAELVGMVNQLDAVASPGGSWGPYGDLETFETATAAWMANRVLETSGAHPATEVSLQRLARLERWIDAHLAEDITLARLCTLAGVGERALQRAYLGAKGQTPLEFVNARRLAAARRRLETGRAGLRVWQVAVDCGFDHFGRFAASYRTAFGESPSDTLSGAGGRKRSRGRGPA